MLVLPAYYQRRKGILLLPEEIRVAPKTKGGKKKSLFLLPSDSVGQSPAGHRKVAYSERQGNCIHVPEEMNQH